MLAIIVACACSKPGGPPTPRRDGEQKQAAPAGGWTIERIEGVHEDDAGDDGDAQAGRTSDANADAPAATTRGDEPAGADDGDAIDPTRPAPVERARTPIVPADHPQYGRLEGDGLANACKRDGECSMGGCAREVCSAQRGVTTTCELLTVQLPTDAACGCVAGECVWWSRSGTTLTVPKRDGPRPNRGEAPSKGVVHCGGAVCKPGQQCIEYFGIAGTNGPRFESCEWPCGKGQRCPKGTTCTTISDGPGKVCR